MLRERGLFPLDVASVAQASGSRFARRRRLSDSDLTLLTRQWSTLLASGLTVEQALAPQVEPGRHRFEARVPFTEWRSEAVVVEVR